MLWRQVLSHSPSDESEVPEAKLPDSAYRRNLDAINRLISHGSSLSGHERNCAFLNTQTGAFANVSAVTGFDFPDDGRGMALADWDDDGDLDVWLSNRTAPRLRYLRNNSNSPQHISFDLEGVTCNRDAIGARVDLFLAAPQPGQLSKSVRAGQGFLSQSSRVVHFGLPSDAKIDHVRVRWPGGDVQEFSGFAAGRRYHLLQSAKAPRELPAPTTRSINQPPGEQPIDETTQTARIVLTSSIPAPNLRFVPLRSTAASELIATSGPCLINLWSTTCGPCLRELNELTVQAEAIRQAGVEVFALCVDSLHDGIDVDEPVEQLMEGMKFPFVVGKADAELMERLAQIHGLPFDGNVVMPAPVSFLMNRNREVVVMYRGPMEIKQLIDDVQLLELSPQELEIAATFPGKWNERGKPTRILPIPRELLDRQQVDDALDYVSQHRSRMLEDQEFPKLLVWLGDALFQRDKSRDAVQMFELALEVAPNDVTTLNNFAWQLATHPDDQVRNGQRAVTLAEQCVRLAGTSNAGALDTLAACYAEVGRFEHAVRVCQRAISIAAKEGPPEFAERLRHRLSLYQQSLPFRSS